jgi:OmpA-OmpF porin, OOP family
MKMRVLANACLTVLIATSITTAQANDIYVGVAVGQASGTFDSPTIQYFSGPITTQDDKQNSISIYAGANINQNIAVEMGYVDFGSYQATSRGFNYLDTYTFDVSGIAFNVVGKLPVNTQLSLQAKLGMLAWLSEFKTCFSGIGCITGDTNDSDLMFGVGMTYQASPKASITLGYDNYDVDTEQSGLGALKVLSVSGTYHF